MQEPVTPVRRTAVLPFRMLLVALCLAGAATGLRAQDDAGEEIEFVPRTNTPPTKRVGAGTRNPNGVPLKVIGLAPRRTLGYTSREQPTVYFSLSRETAKPIEIAVNDLHTPERHVVAERTLARGHPAGLLAVNLAEMKTAAGKPLRLEEGRRYEVVLVTTESGEGSANNSAVFNILRVAADRAAPAPKEPAKAAAWAARNGLWFDCVDALTRAIETRPEQASLARSREKLLASEGLAVGEKGVVTESQTTARDRK